MFCLRLDIVNGISNGDIYQDNFVAIKIIYRVNDISSNEYEGIFSDILTTSNDIYHV